MNVTGKLRCLGKEESERGFIVRFKDGHELNDGGSMIAHHIQFEVDEHVFKQFERGKFYKITFSE